MGGERNFKQSATDLALMTAGMASAGIAIAVLRITDRIEGIGRPAAPEATPTFRLPQEAAPLLGLEVLPVPTDDISPMSRIAL